MGRQAQLLQRHRLGRPGRELRPLPVQGPPGLHRRAPRVARVAARKATSASPSRSSPTPSSSSAAATRRRRRRRLQRRRPVPATASPRTPTSRRTRRTSSPSARATTLLRTTTSRSRRSADSGRRRCRRPARERALAGVRTQHGVGAREGPPLVGPCRPCVGAAARARGLASSAASTTGRSRWLPRPRPATADGRRSGGSGVPGRSLMIRWRRTPSVIFRLWSSCSSSSFSPLNWIRW